MPFRDKKSLFAENYQEALDKIKNIIDFENSSIPNTYTKILIGHLALKGSLYIGDEFNDLNNELLIPLEYFKDYNYTWMGHVHKPQVMQESPYIAHIGSMDISGFGEVSDQKELVLFENNSFSTIYLPNRQFRHIVLQVPEDITDINKYIKDYLKEADLEGCILRLELNTLQCHDKVNRKDLEKYMDELKVFYISNLIENRKSIASLTKIKDNEEIKKIDYSLSIKESISKYSLLIDENSREKYLEVANNILLEMMENK